jgi:hypothetical protein
MSLIRLALLSAGCLSAVVSAQCPGSWIPGFGAPGADARVRLFAIHEHPASPLLFAGGDFTSIGGVTARGVAEWNGVTWSPLGSGLSSTPTAMALFDDGGGTALYVTGSFLVAGGILTTGGFAKWNGSFWSLVTPVPGGFAKALAVFDDGSGPHLYAGGNYAPSGVMKFNGTSWIAMPGHPGITSADVRALAVIDLGAGPRLYSVGQFTTPTGTSGFWGRWNGSGWEGGPLGAPPSTIAALETPSGVSVYVGGQSAVPGQAFVDCVIGPSPGPLGAGLSGTLHALAAFDDGGGPVLHAAGTFGFPGGVPARLARWDGMAWSPFGNLAGCSTVVGALASFDPGSGAGLVIGGEFDIVDGVAARNLARFDGTAWSTLTSGATHGIGPEVFALESLALPAGAGLHAGGSLCLASPSPAAFAGNVARWDGTGWQPLGPGLGAAVRALEGFDDGSGLALYAGGRDLFAGTVPLTGLGRWDGSAWSAVGGGLALVAFPGASPNVVSLRTFDDGSGPALFVGGLFDRAGGITVSNVASWNGASWSPLAGGVSGTTVPPGVFPGPTIMEVYDDGSGAALYVSGSFSSAGGQPAQQLAKWNGVAWAGIPTGFSGSSPSLSSMTAFDDGSGPVLWVTGSFSTIAGLPAPGFAKWNGLTWAPGVLPAGAGGLARLAVLDDGSGPALHAIAVQPLGMSTILSLVRWNGGSWTQLGSQFNFGAAVNALTNHDDGSGQAIFAGGTFKLAGGVPSSGIAKWATPRPGLSLSQVAGSGILISDQHLLAGHEYFNVFSTVACSGPPGSGPWVGLCAPDPTPLFLQFQLPLGALPFHFVAGAPAVAFGPYPAPPGLVIDGVCFDFTGATLGCRSPVSRIVVQ